MVKREHIAVYEGTFVDYHNLRKVFAKQGVFEGRISDDATVKHMLKLIIKDETIQMMLKELNEVDKNVNTI